MVILFIYAQIIINMMHISVSYTHLDVYKRQAHCCWFSMEIINTELGELISWSKSILIFTSHFHKSVRYYLHNLDSLNRSISKNFPFKQIFLRMELNTVEWIFFSFEYWNKFLILRRSWSGNQIPESLEWQISVICI